MVKAATSVLDAPLENIQANSDRLVILSAEPTDYADVAGKTLGAVAVTSGDFTIQDASANDGREAVVANKTVPVASSGTMTWVALVDDNNSVLLYDTEVATPKAVTAGIDETMTSWLIRFRQAVNI